MKISDIIPSLNAGELSPRLHNRLDFAKYKSGLATCENFKILPEGGIMRRPGTRFVAEAKESTIKGRLKKFQFSVTQAYILELGEHAIRFYRHQGQITVADTDAAVTNGNFDSGITDWDDQSTGGAGNQISHDATNNRLTLETSGVAADDIGWAEQDITTTDTNQEHVIRFQVVGDPGDKIEFQVGTSSSGAETLAAVERQVGYHCIAFTPTTSPFYIQFKNKGINADKDVQIDDVVILDDTAVEVITPWPEAALFDVEGPQSADELYMFHDDYPTHKLQRYGHTSWSITQVAWQDGPYLEENSSTTTLLPSAATGLGINLTLSSIAGVNSGLGWQSTDIGRLVRYKKSTAWGWAIITSITSTTVAVADVKADFEAAPDAQTTFRLGAWSGTTGYPQASSFFEQRLYVGATTHQPQTFGASQTADFENFTPDNRDGDNDGTIEDTDAFNYTLSADDVNAIHWMSAGADTLVIGTSGGEWVPTSSGIVITPNDITVRRQTTHGSSQRQPVRIGHVVLFIQRAKRKIREFGFSFEVDGYVAPDLIRLAQNISFGGITEMAYQEEPDSTVHAIRKDGQMPTMTYRREEDVVGWSRYIFGGSFGSGNAVAESVRTIPGADGSGQVQDSEDRDEVWVIVKRTIDGVTKRYIEVMEGDHGDNFDQEDAYYSDSLITYDGSATTSITGLSHLEGETVKILADGAIHAEKTVSAGAITLDSEASVVQIGLGYSHKMNSLKVTSGNPAGTALGRIKRIFNIVFALLNTQTIKYGNDSTDLVTEDFRNSSDPMDAASPLFTGEKDVDFHGDWGSDSRIYIESDDPVPFTLLAIAPSEVVNPRP